MNCKITNNMSSFLFNPRAIYNYMFPPSLSTDLVFDLASILHEEWRNAYNVDPKTESDRDATTGNKIRNKKCSSDGSTCNINQPFKKIHPDWQKENLTAARIALMAVQKYSKDEAAASYIHDKWMLRNPKEDWNAHQHKPYNELPEDEKAKDLLHVSLAKKVLREAI